MSVAGTVNVNTTQIKMTESFMTSIEELYNTLTTQQVTFHPHYHPPICATTLPNCIAGGYVHQQQYKAGRKERWSVFAAGRSHQWTVHGTSEKILLFLYSLHVSVTPALSLQEKPHKIVKTWREKSWPDGKCTSSAGGDDKYTH